MPKKKISFDSPLDEDLKIIYGNEDGPKQGRDFSQLTRRSNSPFTRLFVAVLITLFLLSGIAWGFYALYGNPFLPTNDETLVVTIEADDEVISGQEIEIVIRYENRGELPIAAYEFELNAPAGFSITKSEPVPTDGDDVWTIGSIAAGSDGSVKLKGVWTDAVPSTQNIQVISSYRPANFNADFQDIATKTVLIETSTLTIKAEGADAAEVGENVTYTFTATNTGTHAWEGARLRLALPDGFTVTESNPEPAEGGAEWLLERLESEAVFELTVSGSFASDATDLQTMSATLGVMRDTTFVEQAKAEAQTDVEASDLGITMIVNGSTDDQTIDEGDTLRVSLSAEGGDDDEITMTFTAETNSGTIPIDWSEADLDEGEREGDTVRWSGTREVDLSLPVVSGSNTNDTFTLLALLETSDRQINNTPMTIRVNSDTAFSASAHYYLEDVAVGSGPLPPTVGEQTTYRVVWTIENTNHDLSDVEVTASVPPSVTFETVRETEVGVLNFDAASRELTWTITRLSTTQAEVSTTFDLSITPSGGDIGSFVKLMNEARLTATDETTDGNISRTAAAVTTDIDDEGTENKGVVVE